LIETKLIIWDEAPMINRFCFEALDITLRDVMTTVSEENALKPFGGKVIVLGGDFRKILLVVKKGLRYDIVKAIVNYSELLKHCKVFKVTENMRLNSEKSKQTALEIKDFADWILHIGDGDMDLNELGQATIEKPQDILILNVEQPLLHLVEFVYPGYMLNLNSDGFFDDGAILCPTTECVDQVNDFILTLNPREEVTYSSSDSPCQSDQQENAQAEWFTTEFLNDIKCSRIPNHSVKLKVGVPIMLLRNIDQANGLFNGTRLQVIHLGKNVIVAKVITGKNIGVNILIPRMNLTPSELGLPFKFQRRQFPISLCFVMTINKAKVKLLIKLVYIYHVQCLHVNNYMLLFPK